MTTAFDRYGEALGIWKLPAEREEDDPIELKLQMGDGRNLRDLLMNEKAKKDKQWLMKSFEDFMNGLIRRDYPQVDERKIKGFVEMNLMKLFDSAQVTFRFTTQEELDKAKKELLSDLKKSIGDS